MINRRWRGCWLLCPSRGRLEWMGLRPARRTALEAVAEAEVLTDSRLAGDHASPKPGGKRQITLIQHEHLASVAGFFWGYPSRWRPAACGVTW